jgi:nucleotide-binding universal stress UspA family protein
MYYGPTEPTQEQLWQMLRQVIPSAPEVEYEHRLLFGHPAQEIVSFADTEHVDLIVIGTHGRTGLFRMIMGSTAESVVRHANCPVATFKHPKHKSKD